MWRRGVLVWLLCLATLCESTDRLSRFWTVNVGAETTSLYEWSVISAGIIVAVALVLSMFLIFEHLAAYNKPEEQKFLVGLIPCLCRGIGNHNFYLPVIHDSNGCLYLCSRPLLSKS